MNISTLFEQKKFVFSFEVFPPKRDGAIQSMYDTIEALAKLKPDFISVTYGAGGNPSDNSTCELADIIKNKYGVEALAHLTCVNSTKQQVDETLVNLKSHNISNILALRGDINPEIPRCTDFEYASDLTAYIKANSDFNVAGACYPECHCESTDSETDINNLKYKINAGTSHLISQLFFDNTDFYTYMYKLREAGIKLPVQAGIMPITNKKQIERIVSQCGASLPKKFVKIMNRYENHPEALRDAGIAYATEQIVDLISNSVDGVHIYTMNKPDVAYKIHDSIKNILAAVNN